MPNGGTLTISCRNQLSRDLETTDARTEDGRYVEIDVTDSGTGIPAALRAQLFEPFFTTKEIGEGTGLGLSMVYGFITQSHGRIEVLAPPVGGTTMRLTLPKARPSDLAKASPSPSSTEAPQGDGHCILVVEDEERGRETVVAMVNALGYRALAAASAREAQALFKTRSDIDVVITDVILGSGMSGPELATDLREREPRTRVMFMSGYAPEHTSLQTHLGAHDVFVQKPFTHAQVAQALYETLASR